MPDVAVEQAVPDVPAAVSSQGAPTDAAEPPGAIPQRSDTEPLPFRAVVPDWFVTAGTTSANASLQQTAGSPSVAAVLPPAALPPLVLLTGEVHPVRLGVYTSPSFSPLERPG